MSASEIIIPKPTDVNRIQDEHWRLRAGRVLPNGMYGHIQPHHTPANYPQFFGRSAGARVWDVDGNEYVDMLCAWGPMILGYGNEEVEATYQQELKNRDLAYGASPRVVELAERFVELNDGADWAIFGKNGGDATTLALTIARAATGKKIILKAGPSYHGATPWFTPVMSGITPEDRANIVEFEYNDKESFNQAVVAAGDDFAGIIITPHRHDTYTDQIPVDLAFAQHVRHVCDARKAVLILDDVRAGFRTSLAGSWAPIGIRPDMSTFSKCIANGHALSALTGIDSLREAASSIYAVGSFWYASGAMAAGLTTLRILEESNGIQTMTERGNQLVKGIREQAASYGINVVVSGPPTMPFVRFEDGKEMEHAFIWCEEALRRGAYVHPWHNWFLSTAHTKEDIDFVLSATDCAFRHLASRI
ncbi:MAG TPA: aminotransferase class III-fold pyridoxal phosphate-dependent enzyme [Pseudomonas sp.]|jgi:glutamate-1-semialdehyde 2,1-aminomutase|uniref:aminotransferase class III-fold pyridoxal phosphate-dependent enzyme n=1 Tax=Pseudomonas sp. TaxID=306 RepID=UPI002ED9C41A